MREREERIRRGFGRAFGFFATAFAVLVAGAALLVQVGLPDRSAGLLLAGVTVAALAGFALAGRSMRLTDFQFAGRVIPSAHGGMASAAAFVGGSGLLGLVGLLFGAGEAALAWCLGVLGGFVLLTVLVAAGFRNSGAATVTDLFVLRFGNGLIRAVTPIVVFACSFALLVVEVAMGGRIAAALFGLERDVALMLVVALVLLPVLIGGLRSLAMSGAAQYVVLAVGFLAPLVYWSTARFGFPLPQVTTGAALDRLSILGERATAFAVSSSRYFPAIDFDGVNFVLVLLTVAAGIAGMPHLVMRSAAAGSTDGARRAGVTAFVAAMFVVMSAPVYALYAKLAMATTLAGSAVDRLPPWLSVLGATGQARVCGVATASFETVAEACARYGLAGPLDAPRVTLSPEAILLSAPNIAGLPPLLSTLLALAVLAALLAAAASLLFAVGSSLGHDLYIRLFEPHAPSGRRLIAIRVTLLAAGLLAGWFAARGSSDIWRWAGASLSIAAAGIFPILVLAIWWRRCTSLGALTGMVCGAGLAVFYFAIVEMAGERPWALFWIPGTAVPSYAAAAFGLPVAFAVAILVSLATPSEAGRDLSLEAIRHPTGGATLPQDDD